MREEEKVYVCTKYNGGSLLKFLGDLSAISSIAWNDRDAIIGYIPPISNGYLFIEWIESISGYYLAHGSFVYGARLVTPNEFKRIAAELCPKED